MGITQGMGARVQRVEDDRYLQGRTSFIDSLQLPRMLSVAFIRSPYAHAKLLSLDVDEAQNMPGVHHVMTNTEANELCLPIRADRDSFEPYFYYHAVDYPVMANQKIRYVGEILAAVVADDRYKAEDAAELVFPDVDILPVVAGVEAAMADDAPLVHDELGHNRHYFSQRPSPEVDDAMANAHVVVKNTYRTNRHCASPMETRAVVANYNRADDRLEVWTSSQMPHMVRTKLSDFLNFPEHKIRVVAPDVGGGFGLKCHIFPEEVILAALALKLKRPVKWIEDRQENYIGAFHAKDEVINLAMSFDSEGLITGIDASFHADGGAYTSFPFTPVAEPSMASSAVSGPYKVPAIKTEALAAYTNKSSLSVCRGVGLPIVNYALEHSIDEAADQLGLDPAEIRRRNLVSAGDFPFRAPTGATFDSGDPVASLDQVLEVIGYESLREEQKVAAAEGRYLGIGISSMMETTTYGKDIMSPMGKSEYVAVYETATLRVDPDGGLTLSVATHSHGQSHATTYRQLVAGVIGCDIDDIRFVQGDTDQTPYGSGTWGSRSAVSAGGAVLKAATQVRDKAMRFAAHMLEAAEEDVTLTDEGEFALSGAPTMKLSLAEIARAAVYHTVIPPGEDAGLEATASHAPDSPYTVATHVAVVEVDADTGKVDVLRYAVSEDCGRMINPMVVEGQVMGGVVQGIGSVMFEHLIYDEDCQMVTATMADYLMPTAPEMPNVEIAHMETPSPISEGGIKGMGEGGAVAPYGAVCNAVSDALKQIDRWQPITQLPITPQRVFEMLHTDSLQKESDDGKT